MRYIDFHTHRANTIDKPLSDKSFAVLSVPYTQVQKYPEQLDNAIQTLELHPWWAEDMTELPDDFVQLAAASRFAAIGEAGLDRLRGKQPIIQQIQLFRAVIKLAMKLEKPLIIHCVKCFSELLQLAKELNWQVPTIIHYFRGTPELAAQLLARKNFYLSIPPAALNTPRLMDLFKNDPAARDQTVLETDDTNGDIIAHYQAISAAWGISEAELLELMQIQYNRIFGL